MEGSLSALKLLRFMIDQKLMSGEHVHVVGKRLPQVVNFLLRK